MLDVLAGYHEDVIFIMRESTIISIELMNEDGTITFHDSLNLLPAKLDKLALSFGLQGKMPFDYENLSDMK